MPLSNLPTGTVSPGESRGTRPRDGDTPHAESAVSATDTDRDLYVAELEHENATLRAELDRRADREAERRRQYEHAVSSHDQQTAQSDTAVPDDSLRLRLARLLRLR
ncbi:hypothetical protein [Salinirubrum litoreum]|uniref:Uncharacterized protein n=1 Tax=Salinirubrum litoreum TaxID=1126234 RepID=A0ABD5RDP2_9EURY|nr:hypothetical protein [Salinirubrum litoreum]